MTTTSIVINTRARARPHYQSASSSSMSSLPPPPAAIKTIAQLRARIFALTRAYNRDSSWNVRASERARASPIFRLANRSPHIARKRASSEESENNPAFAQRAKTRVHRRTRARVHSRFFKIAAARRARARERCTLTIAYGNRARIISPISSSPPPPPPPTTIDDARLN